MTEAQRVEWLRHKLHSHMLSAETLFATMDNDRSNSVGQHEFKKGP